MAIELLSADTAIEKWELIKDKLIAPIKVLQSPRFELLPKHPIHKTLFNCLGKIHATTEDTDFILDATLFTVVRFEHSKPKPTIEELYEAYTKATIRWESEILLRLRSEGFGLKYPSIHPLRRELVTKQFNDELVRVYPEN